ncbi:hypothetical protein QJS66_08765 [Kocuria rhizophila]|nr:hypothetical protein QJS66_08765 [Kocuria rhizophila]
MSLISVSIVNYDPELHRAGPARERLRPASGRSPATPWPSASAGGQRAGRGRVRTPQAVRRGIRRVRGAPPCGMHRAPRCSTSARGPGAGLRHANPQTVGMIPAVLRGGTRPAFGRWLRGGGRGGDPADAGGWLFQALVPARGGARRSW